MGLRWGGRAALDLLEAEIEAIKLAAVQQRTDPHNPRHVDAAALDILDAALRLQELIREQLMPLLEKQPPALQRRLQELEQRLAALEGNKVLPLPQRREASGK